MPGTGRAESNGGSPDRQRGGIGILSSVKPQTLGDPSPSPVDPAAIARPVVLIPACNRDVGPHPSHVVVRKYVDAVRLAGCMPLVVPTAQADEIDPLLDLADGVLLTGSPSNVDPSHFGEPVRDPALPTDPDRDASTLRLVRRALERGVPLFGICRGLQEINVALGGTLHQAVQEVPGRFDHREPPSPKLDVQYAEAHEVAVEPAGQLAAWLDRPRFRVNSLHGQGVARLAPGLRVEAVAPDGQIEAFSMPDAPAFNLAVQWHPEWEAEHNPVSMRLLAEFGAACAARHAARVRE